MANQRFKHKEDYAVKHYRSFYEAAKQLQNETEKLLFYIALDEYQFDGKLPNFSSPSLKVAFTLSKSRIDVDARASKNGSKGGAPKGNKNAVKKTSIDAEKKGQEA